MSLRPLVFLRGLLHLLFPACCHACGRPLPEEASAFCDPCRAALVADPTPSCPGCAATVGPFAVQEESCAGCRSARFAFAAAVRLGPYDGLLRELILRLKHHTGEGVGEILGELWARTAAARIHTLQAEVVVPVPLHWRRRRERGYNQAAAIAFGVARGLGLPYRPGLLRRVRNTPKQTSQTFSGRRDNVRGAFRAPKCAALRGRRVLLVDDVMTTGATADGAAQALRDGGAAAVVVGVLGRAG